jgi:hypothetical protein
MRVVGPLGLYTRSRIKEGPSNESGCTYHTLLISSSTQKGSRAIAAATFSSSKAMSRLAALSRFEMNDRGSRGGTVCPV